VLAVGDVLLSLRTELRHRGVEVTHVESFHDAFALLAERDFHAVLVESRSSKLGRDFVDAIKEGAAEHERTVATLYGARGDAEFLRGEKPPRPETLTAARARHRLTPFILPPDDWEHRYYTVVIVPPEVSFIRDTNEMPLISMILTVDPLALFAKGKALA
jgi:hypothetical protein